MSFNEILWHSAVEANPPAVTARALMWFLSFFFIYDRQRVAPYDLHVSAAVFQIPASPFGPFEGLGLHLEKEQERPVRLL